MIDYSSPLLLFGFFGILTSVFLKVKDINESCADCSIKKVWLDFAKHEWPSYSASFIIILVAALSHNEWGGLNSDNLPVDSVFKGILSAPKLVMYFVGLVGQWAVYKYWLGKRKSVIQEKE